ncbi:MAG: four helix bundle protein [Candidatus Marinimicrobia bacterium]|nr:four helix bundle protein [Candidatus Neomarinimicrobiota bacterium]
MLAKSVNDLQVYKLAVELQRKVFELSKTFPKEEMYSLTDQIRRSSRSVGANICEAWAKRRYPAHFESKLSDSDGESEETIHWLTTACDCRYIEVSVKDQLSGDYRHVSGILNKMMNDAQSWCKHYIK